MRVSLAIGAFAIYFRAVFSISDPESVCAQNCGTSVLTKEGCYGQECGCEAGPVKDVAVCVGRNCPQDNPQTVYEGYSSLCEELGYRLGLSEAQFVTYVNDAGTSTQSPGPSTATSDSTSGSTSSSSSLSISVGAIAGIAVGGTVLVIAVLGLLFYLFWRRRRDRRSRMQESNNATMPVAWSNPPAPVSSPPEYLPVGAEKASASHTVNTVGHVQQHDNLNSTYSTYQDIPTYGSELTGHSATGNRSELG